MTSPPSPQPDQAASINRFWSLIDQRVGIAIRDTARQTLGVPRPRTMTVNFPLADAATTPPVGWLQSVVIMHNCRIAAWEINALVAGQIVLDLRVSMIPGSPSTPPVLVSLPGAGNFPALNGYGIMNADTSGWAQRDIQAGSVLHVFVLSASAIRQAIFGLQAIDLFGKVLQL